MGEGEVGAYGRLQLPYGMHAGQHLWLLGWICQPPAMICCCSVCLLIPWCYDKEVNGDKSGHFTLYGSSLGIKVLNREDATDYKGDFGVPDKEPGMAECLPILQELAAFR